ncbi:MAG TPA: hypothetical protein VD994_01170 [Prosthecobacter sp.]|nr:hypothetical protein [Prosthecobacter sp.]
MKHFQWLIAVHLLAAVWTLLMPFIWRGTNVPWVISIWSIEWVLFPAVYLLWAKHAKLTIKLSFAVRLILYLVLYLVLPPLVFVYTLLISGVVLPILFILGAGILLGLTNWAALGGAS